MRVVLARAARSARRTTHFDLDFPRSPQREPYWCHKHKRECRPVDRAAHFLRRYALDTAERVKSFARLRRRGRTARVFHGDARTLDLGGPYDAVVTSPPYPGLIDYHEQHHAYELLGWWYAGTRTRIVACSDRRVRLGASRKCWSGRRRLCARAHRS